MPKFEPSAMKAQCPWRMTEEGNNSARKSSSERVKLIVRCLECLEGQYNARTKEWECESCFFR